MRAIAAPRSGGPWQSLAAMTSVTDAVWERVRGGRHVALVGLGMPTLPGDIRAIRVSCDGPPSTFGPLALAQRRIEAVLGESEGLPLAALARSRVVSGLRRHLFGELSHGGADAGFVEVANRLVDSTEQRTLLIFDVVEAADDATLATLRDLLQRPAWLRLPMLLVFRSRQPGGMAGILLDTLLRVEGFSAVVQAGAPASEGTEVGKRIPWQGLPDETIEVLRAGAVIGAGFEIELVARLLDLSPLKVLLRLQAAADAGAPLEDRGEGRIYVDHVWRKSLRATVLPSLAKFWHQRLAGLLSDDGELEEEQSDAMEAGAGLVGEIADRQFLEGIVANAPRGEAEVLIEAQRPADTVVSGPRRPSALGEDPAPVSSPAASTGAGVASRPKASPASSTAAAAKASAEQNVAATSTGAPLEPSKERSSERSSERPSERPSGPEEDAVRGAAKRASSSARAAARGEPGAAASTSAGGGEVRGSAAPTSGQETAVGGAASASPGSSAELGGSAGRPTVPADRSKSAHRSRRHRRPRDPARAAAHLTAAGDRDAAAQRYVEAAQDATLAGADGHALAHARRALTLLGELPMSTKRRRLAIAARLEVARVEWRSAAAHPNLSLDRAMETAVGARDLLSDEDPPELRAQVAQTLAGIGYDRGDLRSLEQALAALTSASRALMAAGDPLGAASLLNDQAAIYIRLGDPVRALHLLGESRAIFERREEDEPLAMSELAETHHLYARVPLHARVQAGRERDALLMGLDHGLIAEKLYSRLDDRRELARVWETMGRLELRRGQRERAADRLSAALEAQQTLGDAIGLARTSASLSELLAAQGRIEGSLRLLAASIAVNREKASHAGLAFNRQALAKIKALVGERGSGLCAAVEGELLAAEKLLGRRPLPPGVEVGSAG